MEIKKAEWAHELIEKRKNLLSAYNTLKNSTDVCTIGFRTANEPNIDFYLDVSKIPNIKNLILNHIKELSEDNTRWIEKA